MYTSLVWRITRRLAAFLPAVALVAAALAPSFALTPTAAAHGMDDSTILRIRDLDSPAVVRIITEVDAQLICHGCGQGGADFSFPQGSAYPGNVYGAIFSGSGSFISADGYILTASHVVDQDCTSSENSQTFVNFWEQDLQTNYQNYGFNTANDALQFAQNQLNQNTLSLQCGNHGTTVFPSVAYSGQLQSAGALVSWPMTQVVASSPVSQQDTAVIKVDISHDMPYLTLAPQSAISVGETITGIAFPGDADQSSFGVLLAPTQSNADVNTLNSLLSPSTDTGQLTNQQTRSDGTLTYETSGTGYHGSSGGPSVDNQGRIVGIYDYFPGADSNRVLVLVSSSVAAKYVQQAGIAKPVTGSVMPLWTKAVNDYYGSGPCHFGLAFNEFSQLKDQHAEFGGVQPFYLKAEQQQTPQACAASKQQGVSGGLMVLIAVLLVLILGGAGGFLAVQRKRARPTRVPVMAGVTALPMPVYMPAGAAPGTPVPEASTLYSSGPSFIPQGAPFLSGPMNPSGSSSPVTPNAAMPAHGGWPQTPVTDPGASIQTSTYSPIPSYPTSGQPPVNTVSTGGFNGVESPNGAGVAMGMSLPVSGPPTAQTPPSASAAVPVEPQVRYCVNGHRVTDLTAHFCPECGAAVTTTRTQP